MDETEVPQYFICPISLQIMKDPVTAITGISYDRESIEKWLKTAKDTTCPVTKQPLPRDSGLTSNHTLRRLIQAWCTHNGIDRIPTPKSSLNKDQVRKLVRDLDSGHLRISTLKKMEALAMENERNRKSLEEAFVVRALVLLIITSYKGHKTTGLEEALRILSLVWSPSNENKALVDHHNQDLISALMWVLQWETNDRHVAVKTSAMIVLKMVLELASKDLLESTLNLDFFKEMVKLLKENISQQATKSGLHVLLHACPMGSNRVKITEANAVFELIELELSKPEKSTTELIFNLLAQLCSCADGRLKFREHAGAIAMVTKRLLRVSPATNDRAVHILSSISKFSATYEVVLEMLSVGAVSKLCMVTQADCEKYLKDRAKEILRLHSNVWNNSPCIQVYLLTRYQG